MDDAILSAGNHIAYLVKNGNRVVIVSVFTEFGEPPVPIYSSFYLHASGFKNIPQFSITRKQEDLAATRKLGAHSEHLGYTDGGFRKHRHHTQATLLVGLLGIGNLFMYPTKSDLFSGIPSPDDHMLQASLIKKLQTIIRRTDCVYGPLGIGDHVDHVIVRNALLQLPNRILFWKDQPYVLHKKGAKVSQLLKRYSRSFQASPNNQKIEAIALYRSQIRLLFRRGIQFVAEEFYEKIR